eukprot:352159-Chlamydomonas_euryale.AAC.16
MRRGRRGPWCQCAAPAGEGPACVGAEQPCMLLTYSHAQPGLLHATTQAAKVSTYDSRTAPPGQVRRNARRLLRAHRIIVPPW